MTKIFFNLTLLFCLLIQTLLAEVRLPAIISSNMVLQRNTTIDIWGWANKNEQITIITSWTSKPIKIKANAEGEWRTKISTTNSKQPQTIKLKGEKNAITLENILFGEVWLCSGQSNMQQPMKGQSGQPVYNNLMTIAKASNPNLRLFTVKSVGSKVPLNDVGEHTPWQAATPQSAADFSAVGFFYGQKLQEILDVPVGLIQCAMGSSIVEAWTSAEVLSQFQTIDIENKDISVPVRIQTSLYNAMIHPIIPFSIKGVLWYQGESNRLNPDEYVKLFPAMVNDWRQRWGIGDFPFYYVQIAPFKYKGNNDVFQDVENSAFIRESQLKCLDLIPNSKMASALDLGDPNNIHPPMKEPVADRLLFIALNQLYDMPMIDFEAPTFENQILQNGGLLLNFKKPNRGVVATGELEDFEIAGEDRVFYPARAVIRRPDKVFVKSDSVPNPVAVRYAWRNWVVPTLFGSNMIPVSSFRTDNWSDATRAEAK